jgi:hypothetical protein
MTNKANRKDNPRRAARRLAKQLKGWISSALVGQVCSSCGGSLDNGACACGRCELDPAEFQAEEG